MALVEDKTAFGLEYSVHGKNILARLDILARLAWADFRRNRIQPARPRYLQRWRACCPALTSQSC